MMYETGNNRATLKNELLRDSEMLRDSVREETAHYQHNAFDKDFS
jgi:hypothetical protein